MYQLINVSGNDALLFLQGQLTQDIDALSPANALPAAWCTPKGRVVATMRLIRSSDCINLLLPLEIAATFLEKISIYRMRADVQFETRSHWQNVAVQTAADMQKLEDRQLLPGAPVHSCRSSDELTAVSIATDTKVIEVFGPAKDIQDLDFEKPLNETDWQSTLIRSGAVQISAGNTEKYTPHMISLDLAGAVSFDKGCYTGQEIVARTEHRGKSRRRLARYECETNDIAVGDELSDGDVAVGVVVNAAGGDVLAVTPADIHDKVLKVNGADAVPGQLPWS